MSLLDEITAKIEAKRPGQTSVIAKIRTPHHELARLMALGHKDVDISRITGYSQTRICILKKDPLFMELINHYQANRDSAVVDISARLSAAAVTAIELIQERMEDDGEGLTIKELQAVAELGLDRTGYGKTSTVAIARVSSVDEIKAKIQAEHRGRVLSRDQGTDLIEASATAVVFEELSPAPEGEEG